MAARVRIGSLCSGYGGLDMAALALFPDASVAWHVEYNPDASKILAHHWPHIPNHGDVKTTDWARVEPVDVLAAGYPCQPFSHAGPRRGEDDDRHLWPDVLTAIRALRPRLVLLENVLGHLTLGFGTVLGDLAAAGFDAEWVVLRASDVGAPHGRARLFIAARDTTCGGLPDWRIGGVTPGQHERPIARTEHRVSAGDLAAGVHELGHVAPVLAAPAAADADDAASDGQRSCAEPRQGSAAPADACGERLAQQPGSTPAEEARTRTGHVPASDRGPRPAPDWGPYQPAIARWERVLGRPAPRPTEPGRTGRERLSPAFVEWLMGLPEGHVTQVPGLSRNAQLTALGNGVVPQQAEAAYRIALEHLRAIEATA